MGQVRYDFLEMFPFCAPSEGGGDEAILRPFGDAVVFEATVDKSAASMRLSVEFPTPPAPVAVSTAESRIADRYHLDLVEIRPYLRASAKRAEEKAAPVGAEAKLLWGRKIKGDPTPIAALTPESGRTVVSGQVFGREIREVRGGRRILSFNVTDFEGSIHVSRFLQEGDEGLEAVADGMFVTVAGDVSYDRWHGDIAMEPRAVLRLPTPRREDPVEGEKRVELHAHSRLSQLDGLTDITALVQTAARWGHKAVALTDHGVLQGYPELCNAGKKAGIKVIYGVEGYYVNDVDDRVAVSGSQDAAFEDEFVAFDLETTGLKADYDRIIEIGAVVIRQGKELARFQTFVDPGFPIPAEITGLTGIRDADVAGAPDELSAVRAFLAFAGDRVLCGHNADFDMGFLAEACARHGIPFDATCVDTLILSQSLLNIRKHSLDAAASHLGLPEFRHHRASDDALTCGLLLEAFFQRLRAKGVDRIGQLGPVISELRKDYDGKRQPKHIIILVKEQKGIRNLYELVSRAHLEHFKKYPIIPKSLLTELRSGLILGTACSGGR